MVFYPQQRDVFDMIKACSELTAAGRTAGMYRMGWTAMREKMEDNIWGSGQSCL